MGAGAPSTEGDGQLVAPDKHPDAAPMLHARGAPLASARVPSARLAALLALAVTASAQQVPCNGGHHDAERILICIKQFSASEWLGCTSDGRYECHCSNDDGVNFCCGSQNQAEAIAIWEQCLVDGAETQLWTQAKKDAIDVGCAHTDA